MELGGVVLPAELERAVFEAAAVLDYKNISRLMLVAHRVHTWLKPFLYHVLVYRGPNHHRTDAHELFVTHVRHLMLDFRSLVTDIAKILAVCSAVQSLAVHGVLDSSYLPHLALMCPLRLRIQAVNLFAGPPRFSHALFARTTHLQLLDYSLSAFDDDSWASLRALPCLTHLALHAYVAVPAHELHELLRENTRMQALVVLRPSDVGTAGWGAQYLTHDVRFVVAVVTDVVGDWVAGAWGHTDFWARADDVIRLRRQASPNLLPGRSRRQRGIASSAPAAPRIGPARASALRAANLRNYFLRTPLSRRPPALSSSTQPRASGARTNALCSPYRLLPRFARGRSPIQWRRRLPLVFALRRWCEPRRSRVYVGAGSTHGGGEHVASPDFALSMVSYGCGGCGCGVLVCCRTVHSSAGARFAAASSHAIVYRPCAFALCRNRRIFSGLVRGPGRIRAHSSSQCGADELYRIREAPVRMRHSGKPKGPKSHPSSV
ncbi:hypothetical protein C8J57DRAFT_1661163 [Mycena rebaudengoi]|nr:hypothetical protein C8J57DRAFT_1661163 [Mycena rebaudengoi]